MNQDTIARFQLSVWRPARIVRLLDHAPPRDKQSADDTSFDREWLQEEIYHWHPGPEDIWGGITDQSLSNELRDRFIEEFDPSLAPADRSMHRFRQAVEHLANSLRNGDKSCWADVMQTISDRRRATANLRSDPSLALLHHLEWIVNTFGSVPGASVTIR